MLEEADVIAAGERKQQTLMTSLVQRTDYVRNTIQPSS